MKPVERRREKLQPIRLLVRFLWAQHHKLEALVGLFWHHCKGRIIQAYRANDEACHREEDEGSRSGDRPSCSELRVAQRDNASNIYYQVPS